MLKKFLQRNKSKINLFLLAVLLWLFVVTGREYESIVEVPIEAENIRSGKIIVSDLPNIAVVKFQGVGRSLIYLKIFGNAKVSLDLSSIKYYYDFPLTPENVKYPSSLHIKPVSILSPDTVFIRIDEKVERSIPIVPAVEINPKAGFCILGEIKTTPSSILVVGPLSILKDLEYITTEDLILNEVKNSIDRDVKIEPIDPRISTTLKKVKITADIERLTDFEIKNVQVTFHNQPAGLNLRPNPSSLTVKIRGPLSAVKKANDENVRAIISLPEDWSLRKNTFVPLVSIPDNTELVDFEPDSVFITLVR